MIKSILNAPISKAQRTIAKKCGWKNIDDIPVRKNILPEGFKGNAKMDSEPVTIGTKLNKNNYEVLETIMGDDKLSKNTFIKINLTEILNMGNSYNGKKLVKKLLTPENIDKIETQRRLIRTNPKAYVLDKGTAKYISTPAGLNSIFSDVNILKAAAVFDQKTLDKLFKLDIIEGEGKTLMEKIARCDEQTLAKIKNITLKSEGTDNALTYLRAHAI